VGDVKHTDVVSDRIVFGENSPARVLKGHRPPPELSELGAQGDVLLKERSDSTHGFCWLLHQSTVPAMFLPD
jgi:hypothetical protein